MIKRHRFIVVTNLAAISVIICLAVCCQQQVEQGITEGEADILNDRILAVWNEGDLALVDEICTPDCVRHDCGSPQDIMGLDAVKNFFGSLRSSFPDLNMTIDDTIIEDNKIVWMWALKGTNLGSLQGLPPTGKPVHLSGVSVAHLENGKMTEIWDYYNQAILLQQIGFTVAPPSAQEQM